MTYSEYLENVDETWSGIVTNPQLGNEVVVGGMPGIELTVTKNAPDLWYVWIGDTEFGSYHSHDDAIGAFEKLNTEVFHWYEENINGVN